MIWEIMGTLNSYNKQAGILLICILVLMHFNRCIDEHVSEGICRDKIELALNFDRMHIGMLETKSLTDEDEARVSTIDILVFKTTGDGEASRNTYYYATTASSVETGSFKVGLLPSGADRHKLILLVNSSSAVQAALARFVVGETTEKDALAELTLSTGEAYASAPGTVLPMWAESNIVSIKDGMGTAAFYPDGNSFSFMRSLARVNVANRASDFEMMSVHLYRTNSQASLIPDPINRDAGKGKVLAPTVPPGTVANQPISYHLSEEEQRSGKLEKSIYIAEVAKVGNSDDELKDAVCVVVGGRYKDDTEETYYRVDLIDENGRLDVLRNNSYEVSINKILASGYSDARTASLVRPVNNIQSEINVFDQEYPYIFTDGLYSLGLTATAVSIRYNSGLVTINTDYPGGWTITSDKGMESWLQISTDSGKANEGTRVIFSALDNLRHDGYVTVKSGRISMKLQVSSNY